MSRKHFILSLATLPVGLCLATGPVAPAVALERTTETVTTVFGSCAPGDDLLGMFTIRQTSSAGDRRERLHLRLTGTITRTGTGVVGKYAETQLDTFWADGRESYSGVLSRLVVKGGRGITAAGRAVVSADGDFTVTPGLAELDGDYTQAVCDALR